MGQCDKVTWRQGDKKIFPLTLAVKIASGILILIVIGIGIALCVSTGIL